jgi:G protein-coupled receptor GPR1
LGANPNFNASTILLQRQRYQIQVVAATFSSLSVLAALCALYWFMLMRRNFRRDLVLLLVAGDFWKSSWFLISASTQLAGVDLSTERTLCQASGYLLHTGFEACDLAIFLMSLHMSLQIFPPSRSFLGHDGLYRVRYYVIAAWFIIPLGVAGLAFVNNGNAFISQGGFCSLPIRPFWYRLALSWIPRYLIWLFVMGVAIRIYRHVGYEFRVFADESDHSSSAGAIPGGSVRTQQTGLFGDRGGTRHSHLQPLDGSSVEKGAGGDDSIAPDQRGTLHSGVKKASPSSSETGRSREARRQSVPTFTTVFGNGSAGRDGSPHDPFWNTRPTSWSTPVSRRGSRQDNNGGQIEFEDFAPVPASNPQRIHGSFSTINSAKSTTSYDLSQPSPLPPIKEIKSSTINSGVALPQDNAVTLALQLRRKAIQRQLRLLFIYPVVYLILWIMPFVSHAFTYSNYFAQHPVFPINVLSIFCLTIMGFVDVCIFCWREKPWRHVPGSDGTFLGSFAFWRFGKDPQWESPSKAIPANANGSPNISPSAQVADEEDDSQVTSREGFIGSIKRWSENLTSSSNSPTTTNNSQDLLTNPPTTSPRKVPRPNLAPPKRIHSRTHSGLSDRRMLEVERAQQRLAMERSEALKQQWRRSAQSARKTSTTTENGGQQQTSVGGLVHSPPPQTPGKKEWWDRALSTGGESIFNEEESQAQK